MKPCLDHLASRVDGSSLSGKDWDLRKKGYLFRCSHQPLVPTVGAYILCCAGWLDDSENVSSWSSRVSLCFGLSGVGVHQLRHIYEISPFSLFSPASISSDSFTRPPLSVSANYPCFDPGLCCVRTGGSGAVTKLPLG
jgi:hypothetical protein